MRIFILEDNEYRMVKFRRELIGHDIDHADNVSDGIDLVAKNKYDLLFLDHDLGGEEMVDSNEENAGYQLAKFIASSTLNKTTMCVIHSCNPAGAKNMANEIPHAVVVPFPSLDIASVAKWVKQSKTRIMDRPPKFEIS